MAVQDRYSALQNEDVRLFRIFQINGQLTNLYTVPTVEIVDQNGVDTIGTATATPAFYGTFYADWYVPIDLPPGRYYDRWTFRFPSDTTDSQVVNYFEVHPKDAIINFTQSVVSNQYSPGMEGLIRDLGGYFVYEIQHIPVYAEQAMRTADRSRFNFAYGNWNPDPRPTMRVNGRLVDDGWYADYCGNVFFEKPRDSQDVVYGSYYFSYFSKDDLAGFIKMGLNAMNAIPPASQTFTFVDNMPAAWKHGVLVYASMQALRRLLLGLTTQEISIIFGDKDAAAAARQTFQTLYEEYAAIWNNMSKDIKKVLPNISQISIPEYTLPGGKARWYRYMFVGTAGT